MHFGKLGLILIICYDLNKLLKQFRVQAIGILVLIKLLSEPINLKKDISPRLLKRVLDISLYLELIV